MEKITYSVVRKSYANEVLASYPMNTSQTSAARAAKAQAKENPDQLVFITWYRRSDGQIGYYNRDGSHSITGKAW